MQYFNQLKFLLQQLLYQKLTDYSHTFVHN